LLVGVEKVLSRTVFASSIVQLETGGDSITE
jgi:hypothetical protein